MNHARAVLDSYDNSQPFNEHLRYYFQKHKQIGSKDRKLLRDLSYGALRLGGWRLDLDTGTAITIGYFLANSNKDAFLAYWLPKIGGIPPWLTSESIDKKWAAISQAWGVNLWDIFQLWDAISANILKESYVKQLFRKLPVYAYLANTSQSRLFKVLNQQQFTYQETNGTFTFPPATPLQNLPQESQNHLVVQDWNSQRLIDSLPLNTSTHWWDCCAGSGGKSLRMKSQKPHLSIWATDNRVSILKNLKKRFRKTGLTLAHTQQLDLTQPLPESWPIFDGILMDAPCTGSGTWARTPERIAQVDQATIRHYQELQKAIALNALQALAPDGIFIYVTCSVFEMENEAVLRYLEESGFLIESQTYYHGYQYYAETFFRAIIKKPEEP